jgi:hypothetical protein
LGYEPNELPDCSTPQHHSNVGAAWGQIFAGRLSPGDCLFRAILAGRGLARVGVRDGTNDQAACSACAESNQSVSWLAPREENRSSGALDLSLNLPSVSSDADSPLDAVPVGERLRCEQRRERSQQQRHGLNEIRPLASGCCPHSRSAHTTTICRRAKPPSPGPAACRSSRSP